MSEHTPVEMEIVSGGCVWGDCEHEGECPSRLAVVCLECNAAQQGTDDVSEWEGTIVDCPLFGKGAPREQVDALMSALAAPVTDRENGCTCHIDPDGTEYGGDYCPAHVPNREDGSQR